MTGQLLLQVRRSSALRVASYPGPDSIESIHSGPGDSLELITKLLSHTELQVEILALDLRQPWT